MNRRELVEVAKKMVAADSCCMELKEVGIKWINSDGTDKELNAAFVKEMEEDVGSIDGLIAFAESDLGAQVFGDGRDPMIKAAKEAKANGEDTCLCDACQKGKILLAHKDIIL